MVTEAPVEGVVKEVPDDEPDRRLAVIRPQQSVQVGLGAVMSMSDDQFDANLELLKKGKERAKKLQLALLEEGSDYGKVPGIDRPFLHKPGAETFEKAYGLATSYEIERKVGDGVKTPEVEYIVHAKVHLGDTDGPIVAEGVGSCNTHESKYRYRQAKHVCPDCKKDTVIKGRADGKLKGKWWCATRDGGCGHTFPPDDKRLVEQVTGKVENENPWDLANTMLKMARKRAGVDGILTATGTSGLFTQDDDSPAVQRDAGSGGTGASATASTGGEAGASNAQQLPEFPKLPKIPKDITSETLVGEGGDITGIIALGDNFPTDGMVRPTERGSLMGFRLTFAGDKRIPQVLLPGELADQVAAIVEADPSRLVGILARVHGDLYGVPWQGKNEQTGEMEAKPPFYRLVATKVETEAWTVPTPEAEKKPAKAKAAPKGKAKPEPTIEPSEDEPVGPEAVEATPPAAATGPGMSAEDFAKGLDSHRISPKYALSAGQSSFGNQVSTLDDLTDQQRHQLADGLGLFEAP